jgi:hypothetical protein
MDNIDSTISREKIYWNFPRLIYDEFEVMPSSTFETNVRRYPTMPRIKKATSNHGNESKCEMVHE